MLYKKVNNARLSELLETIKKEKEKEKEKK